METHSFGLMPRKKNPDDAARFKHRPEPIPIPKGEGAIEVRDSGEVKMVIPRYLAEELARRGVRPSITFHLSTGE